MKLLFHQLYLIFFLLFLSQIGISQALVKGKLIDDTDEQPIEYASVAMYTLPDSSLAYGAVTNPEGIFEIKQVESGNYFLKAQFLGFQSRSISVTLLEKNKSLTINPIRLKPDERLLAEIDVEGKKATTLHKIDRQVFEAERFQSAQGGTATDLIRNLPAVSVNANGDIAVRGSSGFLAMLNGKPVQSDAISMLNQLPANAIENVEIITAPSAKYDPDGKAGIINIITKTGATDGLFTQVNLRLGMPSIESYDNAEYAQRYGIDFSLNYRKNKWDISLGGSYLRNDISGRREGDVFTIINDTLTRFPSDGERSFDETNLSGRFTVAYTPNKNNSFTLGFYAGERSKDRTADILYFDNHAFVEPNGERLYTFQYFNENLRIRKSDFALGSFDYVHKFNNESSISASVLYEYTLLGGPTTNRNLAWPETSIVLQDEFNTNDNPLNGTRFQLDYKAKPLPIGTFEAGYQFRNLDHTGDFVYERRNNATGNFELVPEFSSTVNLKRQIHAFYGQLSGKKDKWSYNVGLRIEAMDRELELQDKTNTLDTTYLYDFVKPFPSASLQYEVSDDMLLKVAYSRRVDRTTTFKMNPFPEREHSETLEQGDPTLLPEFTDLIEFGLVKDFSKHSVYTTAYFRHVNNVINRVNTVFNDTILNRIYSNVGDAQALGMELGGEFQAANNWKVFAGLNVYRYSIEGTFDNRPVNTANWIYSINANTTVDLSKTWSLQWSLNYLSVRNTAQGEDSRFYNPNLIIRKTLMNNRLVATLQWLNMDMGLLSSNEQRITTWRDGEFFTTTNYVYEVDMVMLNLTYTLNKSNNKAKFIKSEFGEKEF
ncbi:MAG: TonB-dependent receptor [Bacteroidota bacterium]